MNQIAQKQNEILSLNVQLKKLLESQDYRSLNQVLEQRLNLLKQLDGFVHNLPASEDEFERYHQFLREIAQEDQEQLTLVKEVKNSLQQETMKLTKGVKAVNAYHNVSKSNRR
ncbi:flagellar protein FliT [Thalassotalea fusca]